LHVLLWNENPVRVLFVPNGKKWNPDCRVTRNKLILKTYDRIEFCFNTFITTPVFALNDGHAGIDVAQSGIDPLKCQIRLNCQFLVIGQSYKKQKNGEKSNVLIVSFPLLYIGNKSNNVAAASFHMCNDLLSHSALSTEKKKSRRSP